MRGSIYAVGSTGAGSVSVGNEPRLGHQSRGGGERVSRLSQQMSLGLDGRSFFPSCIVLPRDPACVSSQGSWRDTGKRQSSCCPWRLLDSAGCAGNGSSHGLAPAGLRLEQDGAGRAEQPSAGCLCAAEPRGLAQRARQPGVAGAGCDEIRGQRSLVLASESLAARCINKMLNLQPLICCAAVGDWLCALMDAMMLEK